MEEKIKELCRLYADSTEGSIDLEKELLDLYNVSNRISDEDIKKYRKQGYLSTIQKRARTPYFLILSSKMFDDKYEDTDFDILYDC